MNTIFNKMRYALVLGFLAIGMTVFAQSIPNAEKMSMSTLMFLDEIAGKVNFDEQPDLRKTSEPIELIPVHKHHRPIATPDTIDGKVYISAFVRVSNESCVPQLESLGVQVMCTFNEGLMTVLIPINKVVDVAAIEGVTQVEVAELLEQETDLSRQATNVDDILTFSQDAELANLQQMYDGSGVILAVIDNGIDFQHIAFKDKDGNPRIKRAYKYDGSSATEYTGTGTLPTADATDTDHGTHTSSIAGGSSVIVSGTNVTVTDDHANATYGGMAPGADLFLAGIKGLNSTYIANAFNKIVEYANSEGKPLVVSNSYSNTYGPRDGYNTGSYTQIVKDYFGDSNPNKICLFASANRAGNANATEGGGLYCTGNSSSSSPLGSILRYHAYSNTDDGYYYSGTILDAWARNSSISGLAIKIHVLNSNTGDIVHTETLTPSGSSVDVTGLSEYYNGTFTVYWGQNSNTNKRQIRLYASGCRTLDRTSITGGWHSNYTLAIEVYPTSGSSVIDMWASNSAGFFTDFLTTSGHTWVAGTDDMSVSDHAIMPEVISVGSYITRSGYSNNSIGDISPFSGYVVEGVGPQGIQHPWITAPGEVIISAYNHSRTDRSGTPTVNNATNPYGTAQGTSMATPCAAGIVALWLQIAKEHGKELTLSKVKEVMKETAIRDSWVTSGANASHFGNGKIDALAGAKYLLDEYSNEDGITVCEGNVTDNQYLPVYGYWFDAESQHNQMLYPAAKFAESDMNGKKLKTMTFYPTTGTSGSSTYSGINFYKNTNPGTVTFRIANMPAGTTDYSAGATLKTATFTFEKTITMPTEAQPNLTEWVIDLGEDFEYTGGDLLIDVTTVKGRYGRTYFKAETQSGRPSMYSYNDANATTLNYLPMVTFTWDKPSEPITAGTVAPENLDFSGVPVGSSSTLTVTVTNTGNQAFTPTIDTSNLPGEFTVTDGGALQPNHSYELTVTFTPSATGSVNGSFTVTIGDTTYTVTVSGTGTNYTNHLSSNEVMVPVYKTDMDLGAPYTQHQVDYDDLLMQLPANVSNSTVRVLVENNDQIQRYEVNHRADGGSWTIVAKATNEHDNYFIPRDADDTQQGDAVNVPAGTSQWMTMRDNVAAASAPTTYVPVTVASGLGGTRPNNTYGSPRHQTESELGRVTATLLVHKSGPNMGSSWIVGEGEDTVVYCVYIPIFTINGFLPVNVNGVSYEPYLYRAWLRSSDAHDFSRDTDPDHPALIDGPALGPITLLGYMNEELAEENEEDFGLVATIGEEFVNDPEDPRYNEKPLTAFAAPYMNPDITYVVRFYYKRISAADNMASVHRAPVEGGEYFIVEYTPSGNNDIEVVTALNELAANGKQVVGVTYVNPLGMTSDKPFEGVNIVVTHYSDGSVSTSKRLNVRN